MPPSQQKHGFPLISAQSSPLLGAIGVALWEGCITRIALAASAPLALSAVGEGLLVAAQSAQVRDVFAAVEAPWRALQTPLATVGTAFQQRVWRALREIPAGHTLTYGQLAAQLGMPGGARAVVVPCHRVLREDGGAGGYRWGVARKRALLQQEAAWRERQRHVS